MHNMSFVPVLLANPLPPAKPLSYQHTTGHHRDPDDCVVGSFSRYRIGKFIVVLPEKILQHILDGVSKTVLR